MAPTTASDAAESPSFFFFPPQRKSLGCEIKKKRPHAKANIRACHPCVSAEIDATCSDFDFGTALHIAASNLCLSAVKCLLELRANPAFRVSRLPSQPQISDPAPFYPKHSRTLLTQACFLHSQHSTSQKLVLILLRLLFSILDSGGVALHG